MSDSGGGGGGAGGYDISASVSESATTASSAGAGTFIVGGNGGTKWLPLALVVLVAFGLWLYQKK